MNPKLLDSYDGVQGVRCVQLDVLDKELVRRGHRLVRYADDGNVYVRRRRAGARVMASVSVNRVAVDRDQPAQAPGERGQERGGAGTGPYVSGLQLYTRSATEAAPRR